MPNVKSLIDERRAVEHLLDLLGIEGLSGREGSVARAVTEKLVAAGCRPAWIRHDKAHRRIPHDFEVGNLIVKIPGSRRGERRMFSGHMDTVPLCRGAVPVRDGRRIVAKGPTGLGADNRTAVACMVTMAEALLASDLPHPPITLLFTVGEEIGLYGARYLDPSDAGEPAMGFNIDAGTPHLLTIGAIGADRWEADVRGRSSHAGVHPEDGVSATLIASRAIAAGSAGGWFGRVRQKTSEGTSNVGVLRGGEATNQVTDHVYVKGESRSHRAAFRRRITRAWERAFEEAARSVKSSRGEKGRVEFRAETDYEAFRLKENAPVVRLAREAARTLGVEAETRVAQGGLDANWLNAHGIPTVTLGAGQHGAHTVDEYADLDEYVGGCRVALAIATHPET